MILLKIFKSSSSKYLDRSLVDKQLYVLIMECNDTVGRDHMGSSWTLEMHSIFLIVVDTKFTMIDEKCKVLFGRRLLVSCYLLHEYALSRIIFIELGVIRRSKRPWIKMVLVEFVTIDQLDKSIILLCWYIFKRDLLISTYEFWLYLLNHLHMNPSTTTC